MPRSPVCPTSPGPNDRYTTRGPECASVSHPTVPLEPEANREEPSTMSDVSVSHNAAPAVTGKAYTKMGMFFVLRRCRPISRYPVWAGNRESWMFF